MKTITSSSAAAEAAALARLAITMTAAAQGDYAGTALSFIAGQTAAEAVIDALRDGTAQADALEALLADLRGPELTGACSAIAKAVAGRA